MMNSVGLSGYLCLSIFFIKPLLVATGIAFLLLALTGHLLLKNIKQEHQSLYVDLLGGKKASWIERGGFMVPSDMKVVVTLTRFLLGKDSVGFCDHTKRNIHNASFYVLFFFLLMSMISMLFLYMCYIQTQG